MKPRIHNGLAAPGTWPASSCDACGPSGSSLPKCNAKTGGNNRHTGQPARNPARRHSPDFALAVSSPPMPDPNGSQEGAQEAGFRGSFWRCCLALLVGAGCRGSVGAPCRTQDSGSFARSGCATKCLDLWVVCCPNGERVSPSVCAGEKNCTIGRCPAGQICYHFDDPVEVQAYCIPTSLSADLRDTVEDRAAWEEAAEQRAAEARARFPLPGPITPITPTEPSKGGSP